MRARLIAYVTELHQSSSWQVTPWLRDSSCSASQVQEFEPKNMHNAATVTQLHTQCHIWISMSVSLVLADQKADKSGPIWEGLHAKGKVTCNSTSHRKSWVFSASPCQNPVAVYLQMLAGSSCKYLGNSLQISNSQLFPNWVIEFKPFNPFEVNVSYLFFGKRCIP